MKKKVMLLLVLLPIIFMIAIFSITKAVSITVAVPVSGIHITTQNDEGFINLNMATYSDDLYIKAEIIPSNAKNQNYSVSVSKVSEDEEQADIDVAQDGKVTLNSTGKAKVTVTSQENGYTDSVIIAVDSSKLYNVIPSLNKLGGDAVALNPSSDPDYDYEADIKSGKYEFGSQIQPSTLSESTILWSTDESDANAVEINPVTGKAQVKLSGTHVVTVTGKDGVKGDVTKKIKLNVTPASDLTIDGISVESFAESGSLFFATGSETATLVIESKYGAPQITSDKLYAEYEEISEGKYLITIIFNNPDADIKKTEFTVSAGSITKDIDVEFGDYTLGIYTRYHLADKGDADMYQKTGTTVTYTADITPYDGSVRYEWSSSDASVISVAQNGTLASITAVGNGEATLTVNVYSNDVCILSEERKVTAVTPIKDIYFAESGKEYGISNLLAIGNKKYQNGAVRSDTPSLEIRIKESSESDAPALSWDYERYSSEINFTSTDSDIAKATPTKRNASTFALTFGKDFSVETVTITATWKYGEYFGENVSGALTFRAVNGGVNVSDYESLRGATEKSEPVVLKNSIMLGTKTQDVATLRSYVKTMATTYDRTHYLNNNSQDYTVMYAIEFRNSIYGNGYELNADYITRAVDSVGNPLLYKGPLDFVTAGGNTNTAAVKAQDNISFLVRTKGVIIDNVVLKGCSDESIEQDDVTDLTLLNFVGTVLEVASDTKILNSRISNGRTVLRVFGGGNGVDNPVLDTLDGYQAKDERINVVVESSIISMGREFLVKVGSNRAVRATNTKNERDETVVNRYELKKADGSAYPLDGNIGLNDNYFYDNYVTTDLTIKDSVLHTSALFAVGVDAHFGGDMLNGAGLGATVKWHDLCATSLASVVRIEGNTRILDWKNLTNVDSSTLIETTFAQGSTGGYSFLNLNIGEMLKKVQSVSYNNIVEVDGDTTYVHGGIACYGGGYNYSIVDFSKCAVEAPSKYMVNLSVLMTGEDESSALYNQGAILPAAAGPADFRFYMYGADSGFTRAYQEALIASGEAYNITPSL